MLDNCYDYVENAKKEGRPVVGIMCEYTPRELIMAAGAVPVCLCGGSADTISCAERDLPNNLCPLIKSTYGYHVEKSNPFLEWADLVVAETTCDGKKKMFELMGEKRPLYILELTQKTNDREALGHWTAELRKLKAELERRFSVRINREKILRATEAMNRERFLKRRLAELMKKDNPPLTGRQLLDLKSIISCIPEDLRQYEKILEFLENKQEDPRGDARVRVLLTGTPLVHGAERVMDIIEKYGGLVVCAENCTGVKPVLEDVDIKEKDLIKALAEKYFRHPCSVMTPNDSRFGQISSLVGEYKARCVIELVWQTCLTYDVESFYVKKLCREKLGIPYLKIQTDYSPSDTARIVSRIEALFETVRARTSINLLALPGE